MLERELASIWNVETISQEENEGNIRCNRALHTRVTACMLVDCPIVDEAVPWEGESCSVSISCCANVLCHMATFPSY